MKPTYLDFKGTEKLEGFEKHVANVLLLNELGGISDGYQLSHAALGNPKDHNSGYSFGGNQMDLANGGAKGMDLLKDIVAHATYMSGQPIVADPSGFLSRVDTGLHSKGNPHALSDKDIDIINLALSSDYGKDKINEAFVEHVHESIAHVNGIIMGLPDGAVKEALLASPEMQVILNDYHNQLNLSPNGAMSDFLHGQSVTLQGGTFQLGDGITQQQLLDYIDATKYFDNNPDKFSERYLERTVPYIEQQVTTPAFNERMELERAIESLKDPIPVPDIVPSTQWADAQTPPVVDPQGHPILVEKPPEFLPDTNLPVIADAIRGLEATAKEARDEIPQVVPLEINTPVLPPEPNPVIDAARQELNVNTDINTPILDILPDAVKGLMVPEPLPPAPPAWQLPTVELPPGVHILDAPDAKPALEGATIAPPPAVEVVTVQPEASPPVEPAPAQQSWLPPEPRPFVEKLANNEQQPQQSWTERVEASPPPSERDSNPTWTDRVAPEPPPPAPHHEPEKDKSWVEHVSSPAPETHHSETSSGHDAGHSNNNDSGGVGI